ncbi:IclR family transcriptional regulator [Aneurinibacillus sp. REN35]|uniref:IclR family transcriptional regulator n=1 Tax=Aneurinibacillus sp. REN35 TaxID=3237286 RepID=UPI003529BD91
MSDTVKSIEKVLSVVECFSFDQMELSISDIQRKTGYPKSTIFRLLATLEKRHYIEQDKESQKYRLGHMFFRLGAIVQEQFDLRKIALSVMRELAVTTNETVTLNTFDDTKRICIERVDSPERVRNFVRIGERNSLCRGATGKTMLAFLNEREQMRIMDAEAEYIDDRGRLEQELHEIRQHGYGITRGDRIQGSFAVSAPIFDHSAQLLGTLSIAGPVQRLNEEHERFLITTVLEASRNISEKLGYIATPSAF